MAAGRSRRSPSKGKVRETPPETVRSAPLEPIGVVERELTRPDGTQVTVKVPVYPPFRLREPGERPAGKGRQKAS